MRRGRIFIFIALILIIGLAVVALVFRQALSPSAQPASESPQVATVKVFIAGQNIPQGEIITEDVLATMDIPQENVVSVMFTGAQQGELVGKTAKYPLEQGVLVTRSMVSDGDLASGGPSWASKIPQGMTAIAVPTNRIRSVAYGIRDDAHVDVIACFLFIDIDPSYQTKLPNSVDVLTAPGLAGEGGLPTLTIGGTSVQGRTEVEAAFQQGIYITPSEGQQRPRLVCQIVIQNAIVLKYGDFEGYQAPPPPDQPAPVVIPDVVSLAVPPQDSVTLSYLMYSGARIVMTLRNAADESRVATEAATLQFLLSQYNIPVPAKLPYGMENGQLTGP